MTQPASVPLFTAQVKTKDQVRSDILRRLGNHLRGLGILQPNVGPNSDYYGIADGFANEITVIQANGVVRTNDQMPDTAGGANLDRWLKNFGLSRAPATSSNGVVLPAYSLAQGYTNIPVGAVLVDAAGLRFTVSIGGSYGPGNPPSTPANLYVPVAAQDVGAATDHANGDVLTWVSFVPYVGPNVTVGTTGGTDGLSGGNDSEATTDEPPRQRLLGTMQNPRGGGNWADVQAWARASSPQVQEGFVYPALLGPSSVFFAVTSAPQQSGTLSSTSKNRNVPAALISGTVVPYVQGQYSTRAVVVGASAVNQAADVALKLALPSAPTAQPAGVGGGWLDGTPWPSSVGGTLPCEVVSVGSSTQFTVNATTPPTPGVSHIAYVSPSNWQLYTALVLSFTGTSGAYALVIDTPWPNLSADFVADPIVAVFPQAAQQTNYLAAALAGFANLGPGEWATSSIVLVRSFRHPVPSLVWPYSIDANFLRTVEDSGTEVKSAQFLYLPNPTPSAPGQPTITAVDPFTLTSAAPNILVPRSISFYAA